MIDLFQIDYCNKLGISYSESRLSFKFMNSSTYMLQLGWEGAVGWLLSMGGLILLKINQFSLRKDREGLNFPVGIENMWRGHGSLPICVETNRVEPSLVCIKKE